MATATQPLSSSADSRKPQQDEGVSPSGPGHLSGPADLPPVPDATVAARLAEIKARAEKAMGGPWQVIENLPAISDLGTAEGVQAVLPERRIFTAWNHPQLQAPAGVVNVAVSPYFEPSRRVHIHQEDAEFIAHAREDVPWLVERIAQLETVLRETLSVLPDSIHAPTWDWDNCWNELSSDSQELVRAVRTRANAALGTGSDASEARLTEGPTRQGSAQTQSGRDLKGGE